MLIITNLILFVFLKSYILNNFFTAYLFVYGIILKESNIFINSKNKQKD